MTTMRAVRAHPRGGAQHLRLKRAGVGDEIIEGLDEESARAVVADIRSDAIH